MSSVLLFKFLSKSKKIIITINILDRLFGIVVSTSAIQEVPGSIPGYNLEIFLEV